MKRLKRFSGNFLITFTISLFFVAALPARAQVPDNGEQDQSRVFELESKISQLESQLAVLEDPDTGISARLAKVESSTSQTELLSWLTLVVAIVASLSGAALGGWLSEGASRRAERRAMDIRKKEATISICSEWIDMADTIALATKTLEAKAAETVKSDLEGDDLNHVLVYGNWLEMVLLMKADRMLDDGFLEKFEFKSRVESFKEKVEKASSVASNLTVRLANWKKISTT